MSQESSSFDISNVSTASRILLIGGGLYFIDLFLQWNRFCEDIPFIGTRCLGLGSGWHGIGIVNGLLVIAIVVMDVVIVADVRFQIGTPTLRAQIEAGMAWALLLFTLIKVLLVDNDFLSWPAWVGIILAVVIAYGGWMLWQEANVRKRFPGGSASPHPQP